MQDFVTLIAQTIEPYLARNGGPVILAQVCSMSFLSSS
jgi:sorbitol-specific phosphotransferase system component IIBC